MIDTKKLSRNIAAWQRKVKDEIINDLYAKGVRHRPDSNSKQAVFLLINARLRKKFGAPERASFTFPKHLVFVKYGVGKGRKRGSGKEIPKDIIDNVIEKHLPELIEICKDGWAEVVAKNLFIDKSYTER